MSPINHPCNANSMTSCVKEWQTVADLGRVLADSMCLENRHERTVWQTWQTDVVGRTTYAHVSADTCVRMRT